MQLPDYIHFPENIKKPFSLREFIFALIRLSMLPISFICVIISLIGYIIKGIGDLGERKLSVLAVWLYSQGIRKIR